MPTRKKLLLPILILLLFIGTACQATWAITINENSDAVSSITADNVAFYIDTSDEEIQTVPLGQFFFDNGFTLIDQITLTMENTESLTFIWDEIAEETTLSPNGTLTIGEVAYQPTSIEVTPSKRLSGVDLSILDISPTVLSALGLPSLPEAHGQPQLTTSAQQVVIILTDGTQYDKLQSMVAAGEQPFFASQDKINCGISIYPPITTSASAALFTSTIAANNGVYGYGYRSTELTTLFDIVTDNGKMAIAVEGASLPFNLRNAEVILSGDRDNNGWSDDNVYLNAMEVIQNNLPHLLYIHFHEIDDMGHEYGDNSPEYETALIRVDGYIADIVDMLPSDTLIIILADHGMHTTADGGNHGTLTAADMLIPVTFIQK
ncbi:alkaline phosphatase family protein [Chloroflexota bacterium]|nr:alkaline phosphatase family protein [Chloroflexota bacterium]